MKFLSALHTLNSIDHIAPLCGLLDIPVVTFEKENVETIENFYPNVSAFYKDKKGFIDLILDYNIHLNTNPSIIPLYKECFSLYKKNNHLVYFPHGNSDKGYQSHSLNNLKYCDHILYYNDHLIERFKKQKLFFKSCNLIRTGNYRLFYYLQNENFYKKIKESFSWFNDNRKKILYCPTWNDAENSSTLFNFSFFNVPDDYLLIIKPHPHTLKKETLRYFFLKNRIAHKKNIIFLEDVYLIYPLLSTVDIYLGDMSSIGYDFLYFQKPMFFLNPHKNLNKNAHFLYRAGVEIPKEENNFFSFIEKNEKKANPKDIQKRFYDYAFGEEINKNDLKRSILESIEKAFKKKAKF